MNCALVDKTLNVPVYYQPIFCAFCKGPVSGMAETEEVGESNKLFLCMEHFNECKNNLVFAEDHPSLIVILRNLS